MRILKITIFTSILLLLIAGCGKQSDQEKQQQQQRESATKKSQPPSQTALNYKAEQQPKREIEQIENPQSPSSSEQEEQQDESKQVRPIERMEPKHRAQAEWPLFSSVDTDKDGSISKEEARRLEALDYHFKQVDRNEDGKIDRDEFGAFKAMQIRSFYKGGDSREQVGGAQGVPPENPRDSNKSTSTPDEVKPPSAEEEIPVKEPELEQKREIKQIERAEEDRPLLESQQQNEDGTDESNQPSQKESANMDSNKQMEEEPLSFSQLDTDHDGYISKEEAKKAYDQLFLYFKQLDQNNDGKLDSSEFGALRAMQMEKSNKGE
jgi:Ca2+-binding EF-hand superfamily protein